MSMGVVMLVHTAFRRAEQVARHWANAGCPVVVHVDSKVSDPAYREFATSLSDVEHIRFSKRFHCEWGTWGIVAASKAASEIMLKDFPDVKHVYLTSGSCLPLRPVEELIDYLASRPRTDFIESVTTVDVHWTVDGLDEERFTLHFPFSWRRQRFLFDKFVELQRRLGLKRRIPNGLKPHMGSQWWCLTRQTLSAILQDPERDTYDAYFKRVWIPDESYYQTLARQYTRNIESRSLTLSKFDFQGKPHIFYDDHLQLLRRSDCFVARKVWPHADQLYRSFLTDKASAMSRTEPNPGKIDRIFAQAVDRRTHGRPGLYMHSRFPNENWENGVTAGPYSVFQGFTELFEDFETWLERTTDTRVHGHIFDQKKAEFTEDEPVVHGGISDSVRIRDANPWSFLTSLLWNTRGEKQCFQFGPLDTQDGVVWNMAKDPNAQISVISGAWAVPLFHSDLDFATIRNVAAKLQKIESDSLLAYRSPYARARIRIWTLAEFIKSPIEPLQSIASEIAIRPGRNIPNLTEVPKIRDLSGFGQFLQSLKNQGMQPYLIGDFPVEGRDVGQPPQARKAYQVR